MGKRARRSSDLRIFIVADQGKGRLPYKTTPILPRPITSMTSYFPILGGYIRCQSRAPPICEKREAVSQASPLETGEHKKEGAPGRGLLCYESFRLATDRHYVPVG